MNGQRFDAETTRLMGIAFEMALVMLQRTDGIVNPTRDAVAQKIIELAKAGENDPERLCEAALQALRAKPRVIISDPNPLPPLFSPLVLPDFLNFSQSGERPDRALNPDRSQIGTARFRSTRKHAARRR